MTQQLHPRVLELVASRICHDLVSPVGAISNGVELIQEMGEDAGDEAMDLIASSAHQASVRLKAFRLSYGAAGTDQNIGFKDIRDAFTDLIGAGKVDTDLDQQIGLKYSMPPRGFFKTLLNVLILAEESTKGEGKIAAACAAEGNGVTVTVTGNNPGMRDGAEDALFDRTEVEDLDPRSVHAYITGQQARYFGFTLDHTAATGQLTFTLGF